MNKVVKFEDTIIDMQIIDGTPMFELYAVGMALGYARSNGKSAGEHGVHPENKVLFPYKSRIDNVCMNAEIQPVGHCVQPYITESQLYDFMLEARTDKCRAFRKWLTNEVLPELNHTGTYSMPKKNPEPYIYFDKTYNGNPVLSLADVEHFTGAKRNTIMKAINCSCVEFFDYYLLRKKDLMKFKAENPKVNKLASELYIITKDGLKSICKFCKIKPELPSAFTTKVISCKEKKKEEYAVIIGNTRMQGMIKGIKRKLTAVEVLLDSCNRHNMSVNDVETIRQALRKVSDDLATDITVFSYEKYQTTTSFKF